MLGNQFYYRLTYGVVYMVPLLIGMWYCVFRRVDHPRAYSLTGIAMVIALLAWVIRPVVLDDGYGIALELLPNQVDSLGIIGRSFVDSLFSMIPIALMLFVIFRSLHQKDEHSHLPEIEYTRDPQGRWLIWSAVTLVVIVNLLFLLWSVEFEGNWYRLAGAAPYLLFLTAATLFCILRHCQIASSGIFTAIALLIALMGGYIHPWFARKIHLLSHSRTTQYFEYTGQMGYEYQSGHLLERTHFLVSLTSESVPVLLLALAVFQLPDLASAESNESSNSNKQQESGAVASTHLSLDLHLASKHFLAMGGWGLLFSMIFTTAFVAIMMGYIFLFEMSASYSHGAWGLTFGQFVLFVGIVPMFLTGVTVGVGVAAKRARRQADNHKNSSN